VTILYPTPAAVKPARNFGRGLLASRPVYRADHSAADEAWLVEDNARREAEARRFDAMAAESAALDRLEAGLCC
jgi:hypothetical protein